MPGRTGFCAIHLTPGPGLLQEMRDEFQRVQREALSPEQQAAWMDLWMRAQGL